MAEDSQTYVGRTTENVFAIGSSRRNFSHTRYIAIAAGESYKTFNAIQCALEFIPALFDVYVVVLQHNITVIPQISLGVADISRDQRLPHTLVRQFSILSHTEANLWISSVGNAFNTSAGDYNTSRVEQQVPRQNESEATINGFQNSVTVVADDMLVAYTSAQMMVSDFVQSTNATVEVGAVQSGSRVYIHSLFGLNTLILLLCL